jgi:hypothetical protein
VEKCRGRRHPAPTRCSSLPCRHQPPAVFHPGQPLELEFALEKGPKLVSARIYYRHVNQACLFPGFAANLSNQPYFVVRRPQTGA